MRFYKNLSYKTQFFSLNIGKISEIRHCDEDPHNFLNFMQNEQQFSEI